MKTKLITALRTTAKALESRTLYYNWKQPESCNCGALFCALAGVSEAELESRIPDINAPPNWSTIVGKYCPVSGIPTNELFKELLSHGLTQADIIDLEYLRNPKVCARITSPLITRAGSTWFKPWTWRNPPRVDYQNKSNAIAYMRAWADLLTQEGAMDISSTPQTEPEVNHA